MQNTDKKGRVQFSFRELVLMVNLLTSHLRSEANQNHVDPDVAHLYYKLVKATRRQST